MSFICKYKNELISLFVIVTEKMQLFAINLLILFLMIICLKYKMQETGDILL